VWFQYLGRDGCREERIRTTLSKAGVEITALEHAAWKASGIVCFEQINAELLEVLKQVRGRIGCRVLALATSIDVLENGTTWQLLQAGASDVMVWDDDRTLESIRARLDRWLSVTRLAASAVARECLVGQSAAWLSLVARVTEAAGFSRTPILLTGESGTGKEHLARLVHVVGAETQGCAGVLVTVDCSTIVSDLSGSELFGHERGAFTGAHSPRDGAFALADGATLFLDEVGELPLALQAQLLRVLQEKTYKKVGGNVWFKSNFRLVCATNRDLEELVRRGQFRLDLYHRIAGWVFHSLSLRERREDVLPLARHFLGGVLPAPGVDFDAAVQEYLVHRAYPGNIRELRQLVQRMSCRHTGPGPITAGDVPEEDRPTDGTMARAWPDERLDRSVADAIALGAKLKEIRSAATEAAIRQAVQTEEGNLQRAAKRLGVTDRALQMRRAAGALTD
jgi:transcriptional regulator with GAF, ATPase, and Fis domain